MKYLLFSDIHGCLPALERALDFYEAQKCDMMCIMGDIINYGPRNRIPEGIDPKGIVERLNGLADHIIAVQRSIRCCSISLSWKPTPCSWMTASDTC